MNDIIIDKRNLLGYKIESGNHYRSIPCTMVLRLMDTEEYCNNYCRALDLVYSRKSTGRSLKKS